MAEHDLVTFAAALVLAAQGLIGCKPKIGDECSVSTDCSITGDRLCDSTWPAGYCTIFNCEPGTCPEEAICIAFAATESTLPGCQNLQAGSRFERTFCLRTCQSDDDCRGGYRCIDMAAPNNPWSAVVVEHGSVDGHVCAVPASGAPVSPDHSNEVCTGQHDGGFEELLPPIDSGSDAQSSDADLESGGD